MATLPTYRTEPNNDRDTPRWDLVRDHGRNSLVITTYTDQAAADRAVAALTLDAPHEHGALCSNSGRTVSRWHTSDTQADPGPYADGEHVTCPLCSASVPVTPHATTERETGTQYVAYYLDH